MKTVFIVTSGTSCRSGFNFYNLIKESCSKVNANPDDYDLVTSVQRRPIDASQQWRFTSIANNAKLELVPGKIIHSNYIINHLLVQKARVTKSLPVRVAVQSPTGRLTGECLTCRTLYQVLQELRLELPEPDKFPIVSFSGKEVPLDKTLKQIGVLSGSVLLRVHFRAKTPADEELIQKLDSMVPETPSEPATKVQKMNVDEKVEPVKKVESKVEARLPNGAPAAFGNFKFPEESEKMETDEKEVSEERLPCGMKPAFSDFKFDAPSTSSEPEQPQRLPNGQRKRLDFCLMFYF